MPSTIGVPSVLRVARGQISTADVNTGTVVIPNQDARRIFICDAWLRAIGSAGTGTAITSLVECRPNVVLASCAAADTITIAGKVFTAHGTVTNTAINQFSIAGTDTQDGDELVKCINDTSYGLGRNFFASNAAGTVTVVGKSVGWASFASSNSTRAAVNQGGTAFITLAKAGISDGVIKRHGTANVTGTNVLANPTTSYPIMIQCPTADLTTTTYIDYWINYGVL